MHKNVINALSRTYHSKEFTKGAEEGRDSIIQKALKVCKIFKVRSLNAPTLDIPLKKSTYNLFERIFKLTKKFKDATVSQASAINLRK